MATRTPRNAASSTNTGSGSGSSSTSAKKPTRSHTAKPKTTGQEIPGDDAPKAAVQAASGTEYAGPTAVSPEGDRVTIASSTEKYVVRKRTDLPVYEVAPFGYEGPAPLTVPVVDWAEFQKAVAGASSRVPDAK